MAAHPLAPHALVPLYLYSGWSLWESLRTSKQLGVFVVAGLLCTLAVLVPAPLVEFRCACGSEGHHLNIPTFHGMMVKMDSTCCLLPLQLEP